MQINYNDPDRTQVLIAWQTKHRLSAKHAKEVLLCSVSTIYSKRSRAINVTDRDLALMKRYDQDHPNP